LRYANTHPSGLSLEVSDQSNVESARQLEYWLIGTLHHQFFLASAGRSRSDRLADLIIGTARTYELTFGPKTNRGKHSYQPQK